MAGAFAKSRSEYTFGSPAPHWVPESSPEGYTFMVPSLALTLTKVRPLPFSLDSSEHVSHSSLSSPPPSGAAGALPPPSRPKLTVAFWECSSTARSTGSSSSPFSALSPQASFPWWPQPPFPHLALGVHVSPPGALFHPGSCRCPRLPGLPPFDKLAGALTSAAAAASSAIRAARTAQCPCSSRPGASPPRALAPVLAAAPVVAGGFAGGGSAVFPPAAVQADKILWQFPRYV
mmetsp:Transcript_27241/g.70590  ORF Transcript_27241/g.70590 Transcript_27241/m.70590 type:complete len:233 (-) Transcript_27241:2132-2830(-)